MATKPIAPSLGLNAIESVGQVEAFIASIKRLQVMADDRQIPTILSLTTHPPVTAFFAQSDRRTARSAGEPNPFTDSTQVTALLGQLQKAGEDRLVREREKAAAPK